MIGSHLARELHRQKAQVTVADDLSSGHEKNIQDILYFIRFLKCDLRDFRACQEIMPMGEDCVFQLAADMGGIGYITSVGADLMQNSVKINLNMLEASRQAKVPLYFYSSSACVYPEHLQTEAEVVPLKEEHAYPAQPDQFYGWEKLFTEEMCKAYQRDHNMNIRIARFHNIYGSAYTAFDTLKGKAPCHLIIKAIRHPEPEFELWGDGKATRSFCYIDDAIEAMLRLCESNWTQPINIGTDVLVTVDELANIVIGISGKEIEPKHDLSKPQGVRGRNADLTLVKKVLGWKPKVGLEEGLTEVYSWAEAHFEGLENI